MNRSMLASLAASQTREKRLRDDLEKIATAKTERAPLYEGRHITYPVTVEILQSYAKQALKGCGE